MSGTTAQGVGASSGPDTSQTQAAMDKAESDMDAINALNIQFQTVMNDKKATHTAIQTMGIQN